MGAILVVIAGAIGVFFGITFGFMLLIGAAHNDVSAAIPPLGFFQALIVGGILTVVGAFLGWTNAVTT